MLVKWLDRQLSPPGPYTCLCLDDKSYRAALRKLKVKPVDEWIKTPQADATVHLMDSGDHFAAVVCIRPKEHTKFIEVIGLLVHESVHIWQEWRKFYGEHSPGSEQEAYAIQAISQGLIAEYQRQTSLATSLA